MRIKIRLYLICCVSAMVICIYCYSDTLYAGQRQSSSSLNAVCNPDKPMPFTGETIRVRAWVTSSTNQSLQYAWSVTDGTIENKGSEAIWNFAGVWPGTYKATVQVRDPIGEVIECSIQVIVRNSLRIRDPKRLKTGRAFLLSGQPEEKGYGLYSYLLLDSRPGKETRKRYLKAIMEYLRFTDVSLFEKAGIDPDKLNITYLPVDTLPGKDILTTLSKKDLKEKDLAPIAEWVLKHYDYIRAGILLGNIPGNHRKGPYIVSFRKAYDWKGDVAPPYLYQDQSWVPPDLVSEWMNVFLNQAAQERFWDESTGEQLVLHLRTIIGVVAAGVPDVKNSLSGWIKWIRDSA